MELLICTSALRMPYFYQLTLLLGLIINRGHTRSIARVQSSSTCFSI